MPQRHFTDHARETGALVHAGAGESEVVINNDDLIFRPAELTGFFSQCVLARRRLAVMFHLGRGGLAHIDECGTRRV